MWQPGTDRVVALDRGAEEPTPGQIALAWLLARKPWIVPIPGTLRLDRLEENIGAADVQLAPDDLCEIERLGSRITIQGARYPQEVEQWTNR
jgi:aryl-alcohol dehydrogenase-like predicted oxidoreductase